MAQGSKVFRIFVSSTFSDLKAERDALQRDVFPRLRELCVQHGCRFQAIDLRWGISEEAFRVQPLRICLDEIARCRRVTPRPNFIILLGERYGARPVPYEIPVNEFQQNEQRLTNPDDRALLQAWYRRDDNAVPPVYGLRSRTGEFTDLARWDAVERRLRAILLAAIQGLSLSAESRLKYVASATEQEIVQGALRVSDVADHLFVVFRPVRTVRGVRLPEDLPSDPAVADFVDLAERGGLDREAHGLLEDLKGRLRAAFPANITEYGAKWTGNGITLDHLGSLPEDLDACLRLLEERDASETLCVGVWRRLARVILDEFTTIAAANPLDKEIAEHETFGAERARFFTGRTAILQTMADYLRRDDPHPLVIVGASGSGKSALMARAASQARSNLAHSQMVVRFIGATPASADGRALLDSLCHQISTLYDADTSTLPTDYKGLAHELRKRLALATAQQPLVVFVDALDQFSELDPARFLSWLPVSLPAHVRLVVSLSRGDRQAALERRLVPDGVVQLEPMATEEGEALLDLWLRDVGRTLQAAQRTQVLDKFRNNGLPLYLRLVFEEARRWPSYADPRRTILSGDISGVIEGNLFARLKDEANHGALFVARSLGYLAAAKSGLTEDELLDVLSRDAEVLADFHRRSPRSPSVDRLPVVVWSRLFFDLEPYLSQRIEEGATLLTFYHRQLREAAAAAFLSGDGRRAHLDLAQYFRTRVDPTGDARWSGNYPHGLSELPHQLLQAAEWIDLTGILTDYGFLEAKIGAGLTFELNRDYVNADGAISKVPLSDRPTFSAWYRFVASSTHRLIRDNEPLLQLAYNHAASGPVATAAAGRMMRYSKPWFQLLNRPAQDRDLGPWRVLEGHQRTKIVITATGKRRDEEEVTTVSAVAITPDGRRAISGSDDSTLRVWDVESGECALTLTGHTANVSTVAITPDGRRVVSGSDDCTLRVWDMDTSQILWTLEGHEAEITGVAVSPDGEWAVSISHGDEVRVWDLNLGQCSRLFRGYSNLQTIVTRPEGWAVVSDGDVGLLADDVDGLAVWDPRTGQCIRKLKKPVSLRPVSLRERAALSPDGGFVVLWDSSTIEVWQTESGERLWTLLEDVTYGVLCVAITENGRALSGHRDGTLRLWDLNDGRCLGILRTTVAVESLAVTPDGARAVLGGGDGRVRILNLADAKAPGASEPSGDAVDFVDVVEMTRDGLLGVSGRFSGALNLWRMGDGECLQTLRNSGSPVRALKVAEDASRVIVGRWNGNLEVYDLHTGYCTNTLKGHKAAVHLIALSSDGRHVLSGSWDRTLRLWDLKTGACLQTLIGHSYDITAIAITPDGRFAVSSSFDSTVRAWNLQSGECLLMAHGRGHWVNTVAVTPDGRRVVSGSNDRTLRVWDVRNGECLHTLRSHERAVVCVTVVPDGRHAVSSGDDQTLRVWDIDTGNCLRTMNVPTGWVNHLAVTADGRHVVSGRVREVTPDWRNEVYGYSQTLRLWEIESGKPVASFSADADLSAFCITPDLRHVMVGGGGIVNCLLLNNVEQRPPVVTAWRSPADGAHAVACPRCRAWTEVGEYKLGNERVCARCGKVVVLSRFRIEGDWRPLFRRSES